MKSEEKIKFKIEPEILNSYVETINSIKEPMSQIKAQLINSNKPRTGQLKNISIMSDIVKNF